MDKQNYPQFDEQEQEQIQEEALPMIPEISESKPMYELIVRNESLNTETSYLLEEGQEISIGADLECSITVDDDYISSKHFYINVDENRIEARDNNSRNGLYLELKEPTILQPGATFRAGTTTFMVQEREDA